LFAGVLRLSTVPANVHTLRALAERLTAPRDQKRISVDIIEG
jgi:hypothetical protein